MSVADIDMNRNFRKVLERYKQDLCEVILSKESKVLEKLVECGLVKLEEVEMMLTLADRKIIENILVNILSRHGSDGMKKFCSGIFSLFITLRADWM